MSDKVEELDSLKRKYSQDNEILEKNLSLKEIQLKTMVKENNQLKDEIYLKDVELIKLRKNLNTLENREANQKKLNDELKSSLELINSCQSCCKFIEMVTKENEMLKQEKENLIKTEVDVLQFVQDIKEVYRQAGLETKQFEGESIHSIKEMDQGYFTDTLATPKRSSNFCDENDFENQNRFVKQVIKSIKQALRTNEIEMYQCEDENVYSLKENDRECLLETLLSSQKKVVYLPNQSIYNELSSKKEIEQELSVKSLNKLSSVCKIIFKLMLIILTIFYFLVTTILIFGRSGYLSSAYHPYLIRKKISYCQ